jgi:hypothetical protein
MPTSNAFMSVTRSSSLGRESLFASGESFEKLGKNQEAANTYRELLRNENSWPILPKPAKRETPPGARTRMMSIFPFRSPISRSATGASSASSSVFLVVRSTFAPKPHPQNRSDD